jgi:hypothetical protein
VNISANAVHPGVIMTNLFRNRTTVSGIVFSQVLQSNFILSYEYIASRMGTFWKNVTHLHGAS